MARELDKTHTMSPTGAAADTNKHIGKKDETDNDHSGPNRNKVVESVAGHAVDYFVKGGKTLYCVQCYVYSLDDNIADRLKI